MFFYFFLILFGFLCVFLYFLVCFFRVAWLECPKAVKVKSSRLEWPKAGSGPGSGGSGGSSVGSPGRGSWFGGLGSGVGEYAGSGGLGSGGSVGPGVRTSSLEVGAQRAPRLL